MASFSFTNAVPSFVKRNPGATLLASIVLGVAGVIFTVQAPSTGKAPVGVTVSRMLNGSGSQVQSCLDNGNCRFSGSLVTQGGGLTAAPLTNNNTTVNTVNTQDGRTKITETSSGALTAKGGMSGATMTLNIGVAAGKATCFETGGQLSYCQGAVDSKGCSCK